MELSEALKTIDATFGMFRHILYEAQDRELMEEFLLTPVQTSLETFYDQDTNKFSTECREYYTYMRDREECKAFTVDISPVCNYLLNEWPSPTAKRIRQVLNEVFHNSLDEWKDILGDYIAPALEEGYDYDRFYIARGEHPRVLYDVILDTFHEMIHALGLTDEELFGEDNEEKTSIPGVMNDELTDKIHIYFKDEDTTKRFLRQLQALNKDEDKIELVKKYRDSNLCQNTSKALWQALSDAKLYGKGYPNWNAMINKA